MTEIAKTFQAETAKSTQAAQKLSAEQRKMHASEFQEAGRKLTKDALQRIEALLTPPQLAALKDIAFRDKAAECSSPIPASRRRSA